MTDTSLRRRGSRGLRTIGVVAVSALGIGVIGATPALANPGDGGPGGSVGAGEVYITSAKTVAEGQSVSFAGTGFATGGNTASPAMQVVSLKLDAFDSTTTYSGTAAAADNGVVATAQVQADGSVSGSFVVPDDIDDSTVNPTAAGPHFFRFLGGNPATSRWSEDFEVDNSVTYQPTAAATSVVASSRGGITNTITVTGTGFAAGEAVSVKTALATEDLVWTIGSGSSATTSATIAADESGNLSGKLVLAAGALPSGERQLVFTGADHSDSPVTAQVQVQPVVALSGAALDTDGTVTVSNLAPGSIVSSVALDPDTTVSGDEVEVLSAPLTASDAAVATGTIHIPDGAYLGTRTFVVTQSFPYAATYTVTAKVSPSAATFGEDDFARVETADGAIDQGLYQSAYSAASDALFATTANVTTTSKIYKLNPETLAVEASVQPAYVNGTDGALWAAYGVGVDDRNGTVWVTNTRQNTVAVYNQSDLSLLKQFDAGIITHPRDVIADPVHNQIFVSSASEGSSGDGYISVFNAETLEFVENIATYPRTEFSPMSLAIDTANNKLFTVSLVTQKAMVIDTDTLEDTIIDLPDLMSGGRGASGVAYDAVTNRLFIASQNSDELMIAQLDDDLTTGTTVKEVATGAGALNVAFDPVHRWAYVSNFGGTTISVVDVDGNKIANLPFSRVNHASLDGKGSVFAVNKDTSNQVIKLTPKVQAGSIAVSGTAKVGQKLAAQSGAWTDGTTLAYQWLRNGTAISGATKASYTVTAADAGKKLSVRVTGTADGFASASITSARTATVAKGTLVTAKPKIAGKAKVGKKLTAKPGTWTAGTKLSYRWYAGGKAIKGATKATLKLTKAQKGKRVTVKVTGKKAGYVTVTKASAKTAKVKK
ncbi:MAG: hypothetical protein QM655_02435 [Nocardioidaceae bacterium]